jgi:hypothetical protein
VKANCTPPPTLKGFTIMLVLGTLLLVATTFAPISAMADTAPRVATGASAATCQLKTHHITSVTPYRVEERMGKATFSRLRGANVYVLAEPGLTKEWLQLTLARHLTEMRGTAMKDCPLDLSDVKITVDSAGTGFAVRIVARDPAKGEEVLRRAHLLLG